jgi:hypothetical protein
VRDLTGSLTRSVLARLRRDDRGVIGAIVAIMLGSGVLLGMGALVIDVGQIYQERAELQDGADAAALGVAKSCALGTCNPGIAGQLADANASSLTGGTEAVLLVCGSGGLGNCPGGAGSPTGCAAPPPPAGTNFVEVYTATRTASGSSLLPPVFATSLLGYSSYKGTNVQACAQAEWGPPAAATATSLTISACAWGQATQQGSVFPPAPPYSQNPLPAESFDQVIMPNQGNPTGCQTFGWAQDTSGSCTLSVSGSTFPGRAGTAPTGDCAAALQSARQTEVPLLVPVYASLNTASDTYGLTGFADFVVTGYNLPAGFFAADWLNPASPCTGTTYCVTGYFVQGVIPTTGSFAATSLGAYVIDLTG